MVYPKRLSRVLLFFKWLFAIPLYIALAFYGIAAVIVIFLAFWAVLFTGRFPSGMFGFVRRFISFAAKVEAYFPLLLCDQWTPDNTHPVEYQAGEPTELRLIMLKVPSFLLGVVDALYSAAIFFLFLVVIPVWWIILFTGRYPRGLFNFVVPVFQWSYQVQPWQNLMRDEWNLFGTTRSVQVAVVIGIIGAILL